MEMIRARDGAMVESSLTVKEGERRGGSVNARERGRRNDFNVSKDFPITVSDTLHTQLTISPTLTAAQIG